MKVCYTLATTDLEGGAQSLLDLVKYDLKHNIEPMIVLSKKHKELEKILSDLKVKYTVIFHGTDCLDDKRIKTFIKKIINQISVYRIMIYLKKNNVDILHNNSVLSLVGMKAAYKLKIPYVCHIRELIEDDLNKKMIDYDELYFYINNSKFYITISDFVKNRYLKFVDSSKNVTFHDGLDTAKYIIKNKKYNSENKNILFVGRIFPEKGQMDAVKAMDVLVNEYNEDVKLTIIGSVADLVFYEQLKKIVQEKNLEKNVIFLNYSSDLKSLREENLIALVCSSNEAMGRVTVEAMLSKQLVIAANSGATKEIIQNEVNGILYELNNTRDLANKIRSVLNNKNFNKIINAGFKYACENFDNDKQNGKVADLYKKILKK